MVEPGNNLNERNNITKKNQVSALIALIIAGESIFFLPFVIARIFRPTMLEVFGITNTELGRYFSVYGIVAMISYLFGGTLADRFPARNLMAVALWLTGLGGFLMAGIPTPGYMLLIYSYWGFTTICLFWAAMIRSTREWGGDFSQGKAFGWLEGGRGAVAAILGTFTFILFSWLSSGQDSSAGSVLGSEAFQWVIAATSAFTIVAGFIVWFFVPRSQLTLPGEPVRMVAGRIYNLIKMPSIWMLTVIIICAYVGYKISDDFSLYAREVLGYSEVGAAGIATTALWIRAIVAIIAGYLADRLIRVNVIIVCFAITIGSSFLTGLGVLDKVTGLMLLNLSLIAVGIYGVRALYFAVMNEAKIPVGFTGTAVGIVSFLGFTPDVFMSPWMGYLLDKYPGAEGHQYVFLLLAAFGLIGLLAGLLFKYNIIDLFRN